MNYTPTPILFKISMGVWHKQKYANIKACFPGVQKIQQK